MNPCVTDTAIGGGTVAATIIGAACGDGTGLQIGSIIVLAN
jgi:hypothetical protein